MVFGKNEKSPPFVFCKIFGGRPFCTVDTPCFDFLQICLGYPRFFDRCSAEFLWFHFYQACSFPTVFVYQMHNKVHKITVCFVVDWRYIWYNNFFRPPRENRFVIVTINHEPSFPQGAIDDFSWVTQILRGDFRFVLSFV